jgi:hypothetical protein
MVRTVPTVSLTITADGSFQAFVDDVAFEGVLDRDSFCITWHKGHRPKEGWTRTAIYHAASYLVGLTSRGRSKRSRKASTNACGKD